MDYAFIILSFCICVICNHFLTKATSDHISNYVISLCHASIVYLFSRLYYVFTLKFICCSIGYFLYDTYSLLKNKNKQLRNVYILHHVVCICGYIYIWTNKEINKYLPEITYIIGGIELTSSISHIGTLLKSRNDINMKFLLKIFDGIGLYAWIYYRIYLTYVYFDILSLDYLGYMVFMIFLISIGSVYFQILNLFL